MNNQSSGRNQRPKGFKVRWALQVVLILAVCIWVLYQIKHSHDKNKDYDSNAQSKLGEELGTINLGRKGNLGWSSNEGESGSDDLDLVRDGENKEDGGGGDDEFDRDVEEKAEQESYNKENDSHSRVGVEVVSLNKDTSDEESSEDRHESVKGSVIDHDDQEDEKGPQKQINLSEKVEKNQTEGVIQGKDEIEDGVHGFHDENGVPQDIAESMPKESGGNRTILSSNNQSRSIENVKSERGEVKYSEGSNIEDPKNGNVDSNTSIVVSSVNGVSERTGDKNMVSDNLNSVSS